MESLREVKPAMPPPQSPGIVLKRLTDVTMQQHHTKEQQHATEISVKKQRLSEESDEANQKLMASIINSDNLKTSSDPVVIWKDFSDQSKNELETSIEECMSHLCQLHEEEKTVMARIQELYTIAQDMNTTFHQQLDSLHNTVVDVVSSFKT
ncbi:hypothetical protein OTU49_007534 [Cherax quadricarinatus]|uniref:Uncharacterized protein n=1 Tax=Cherax quadricarinatus TaxID=27406 RepID=A0AAW0WUY1_CHEQU|nr:uncharacterized protein LOC128699283 [Cherax quadricarinatus]XP_053647863.1 uncharacterized protein LOC128699283 [Cherax quadricarinatus]